MGAALVRDGRVLAARRTAPAAAAGRWELPGGKVDPGEDDAQALVREVREELGCDVVVVRWLGLDSPVRPGLVLRAAQVRILAGEPQPHEHDAVRWLGPDELSSVDWLDPDLPFLPALREILTG